MASPGFDSDCPRCAALCCVALAFDRSESFGCDKPALEPCAHLRGHDCGIHAERQRHGFAGCAQYQCYGAGPRVLHELFDGRSWQSAPELMSSMAGAFYAMRAIQELRFLLDVASHLPLCPDDRARVAALCRQLEPERGWSLAALTAFEQSSLSKDVSELLRSFRGYVSPGRRLPLITADARVSRPRR